MSFVLMCGALLFFFLGVDLVFKQKFDSELLICVGGTAITLAAAWVFWPT